ncbi:MAG: pyridoxamine 5'-phosphate oxidase family protein [Streptosporangiaceae bacterium]|nr:pyridoxamine 5'-phosphate oxidase family protein [Streptosporangiaceae bacterium]
MATWDELERDVPGFAAKVQGRFLAGANATLATVRRDGAPRISGTELTFADGQVRLAMMADSVKLYDVRRDPRVALHSPTTDAPGSRPDEQPGDAKLAGTLLQTESLPDGAMFRLDITEAVFTFLRGDQLTIESWDPGRKLRRRTRPI